MATSKSEPLEAEARPRARRNYWPLVIAVLALAVLAAVTFYFFVPRALPSVGGLYFFSRLELNVPRFAQADSAWADSPLGDTPGTMAEEGCAVSSAAMVLAYYGVQVDPGSLNDYLRVHGGYTPEGWIYWEKAAELAGGKLRHAYEDLPSYYLIDSNLFRRNPVIIRVHLPSGATHFVVIVGKRGWRYLIQDPASGGERGIYPLDQLVPQIDALRFYEKVR